VGPRSELSTILIIGAAVLLLAIAVGNNMGNHVLGQIPARVPAIAATPLATPPPLALTENASSLVWKRRQVLSVATDPGFPDPRVTPEPPPTPKPTPKRSPSPSPSPTDMELNPGDTPVPTISPVGTGGDQPPAPDDGTTAAPVPRLTPSPGQRNGDAADAGAMP
jgi:hypothetical protein